VLKTADHRRARAVTLLVCACVGRARGWACGRAIPRERAVEDPGAVPGSAHCEMHRTHARDTSPDVCTRPASGRP
jgi:hypothetical protein